MTVRRGSENYQSQSFCVTPACFKTALAVMREATVTATGNVRWLMGLCHISWLPLPWRTNTQPCASSSARNCG